MKVRIKFSKQGPMKFIGHLDVMRFFQKVMRRAEVNIRYSEGFSPHQIMSFAAPLGVGLTSNGEYLDIEVTDDETASPSSAVMVERLNAAMVEGIEVLSYRKLPDNAKNACPWWRQPTTRCVSARATGRRTRRRSGRGWRNFWSVPPSRS